MEMIVACLIAAVLLAGGMYSLNIFNFRTRSGLDKSGTNRYKFRPNCLHDCFQITDKKGRILLSFTIQTLESILLIKTDGLTVDTIHIQFKNEGQEPITLSEDEIDTTELYDQLKLFLKKEDLFIEAMKILENDMVVLWQRPGRSGVAQPDL